LETLLPGGGVKQYDKSALRINVGFLLHQDVGFSRKFEFNEDFVRIGDDLDISHLTGEVIFTRTAQGLYANGRIKARSPLECVRCLSEFDQQLSIEINDLFTRPATKKSDPLLTIPSTGLLDLTDLVREYMILNIPIQPVCGTECAGLCAICGNPVKDNICEHPEEVIDPRLAVLKSLLSES
jgi:uncharacterized protein